MKAFPIFQGQNLEESFRIHSDAVQQGEDVFHLVLLKQLENSFEHLLVESEGVSGQRGKVFVFFRIVCARMSHERLQVTSNLVRSEVGSDDVRFLYALAQIELQELLSSHVLCFPICELVLRLLELGVI